jgi:hypothetical protein
MYKTEHSDINTLDYIDFHELFRYPLIFIEHKMNLQNTFYKIVWRK